MWYSLARDWCHFTSAFSFCFVKFPFPCFIFFRVRNNHIWVPVQYDAQYPATSVQHCSNFPFLVERVLKFGPETIYLVLNMAIFLANIVFKHYHHNLTLKISSDRTRFSFMSAHLKAKKKKVVFNVVRQLTLASRLLVKQRLQLLFKT